MALTHSLKGGEEVGLVDNTLFLIPYLWNQRVLSNDRAFFLPPNGVMGASGRPPIVCLHPFHRDRIEKDPFKKSLGKFYWINPRNDSRQSHLQRLPFRFI